MLLQFQKTQASRDETCSMKPKPFDTATQPAYCTVTRLGAGQPNTVIPRLTKDNSFQNHIR